MHASQRKVPENDSDGIRVYRSYSLHDRVKVAAERALEIAEFHNGDRSVAGPPRRVTFGGHFGSKGIEIRRDVVFLFVPLDHVPPKTLAALVDEILANLRHRLFEREGDLIPVLFIKRLNFSIAGGVDVAVDFNVDQVVDGYIEAGGLQRDQPVFDDRIQSAPEYFESIAVERFRARLYSLKFGEIRRRRLEHLRSADVLAIDDGQYLRFGLCRGRQRQQQQRGWNQCQSWFHVDLSERDCESSIPGHLPFNVVHHDSETIDCRRYCPVSIKIENFHRGARPLR